MNWGYLPFQNPDFGTNFNEQRKQIHQPLLKNYFYDKHPDWKKRKVWLTPDSLKGTKLHVSKHYWTDRGEITIERDFYKITYDEPYDSVLIRTYYFDNDSLGLELSVSEQVSETSHVNVFKRQLTNQEFNSVLSNWRNKLKTRGNTR